MVKLDVDTDKGGITVDPDFLVEFGNDRAHQVRLAGGDASSDSYCYP
jgi:selenium-binding protein 1